MTKPRFKLLSEREKRLGRKLVRKKKEIDEVSQLPKLCPKESHPSVRISSSTMERTNAMSPPLQKSSRVAMHFDVDDKPKPRFWEVWLPDAPKPTMIPSPTTVTLTSPLSIMSSVRAPVVEMVAEEEDHYDNDGDEILVKVILPPASATTPSTKIPLNSAEAEFPSRRASQDAPRYRFAPRLIFPRDVEEATTVGDEIFTIGDEFELGDNKVTEVKPDKERKNSTSDQTRQRNASKGSIHSLKTSQVRRSSSLDTRDNTERQRYQRDSADLRNSIVKAAERRFSAGKGGEKAGTELNEDESKKGVAAGGNGTSSPGQTGPTSDIKTVHVKKKKHQAIVRIPPITQDQWLSIQHAYNKLCPPPPPVSWAAFTRRSANDVRYPVALPDAFELLQEIQSVERLPDVSEGFNRTASMKSRNFSRAFLSDGDAGGSLGSTESEGGNAARLSASKRLSAVRDAKRHSSHRHSSVLYYVDPAIKRESLDVYDIPIEEEETGMSDYDITTSGNERTRQAIACLRRRHMAP